VRLFDLALVNSTWVGPNRANPRELGTGYVVIVRPAALRPSPARWSWSSISRPTWLLVAAPIRSLSRSQRAFALRIRPRDRSGGLAATGVEATTRSRCGTSGMDLDPARYRCRHDVGFGHAGSGPYLGERETVQRAFLRIPPSFFAGVLYQISLEPASVFDRGPEWPIDAGAFRIQVRGSQRSKLNCRSRRSRRRIWGGRSERRGARLSVS
jgi:hypothetical protein